MELEKFAQHILGFANTKETGEEPLKTGIDGLNVMVRSKPTPIEHTLYHPILCLVLQGAKQVIFGNGSLNFGKAESLIVSMDLPSQGRIIKASPAQPYVGIAIEIDISMLRELAEQFTKDEILKEQSNAVATGDSDEALVDAMGRLFDLRDKKTSKLVLEPLIKKEIHYLLLTAEHGTTLRKLCKVDSHASRISRAIVIIKRNFDIALKINDLADVAGMSVSTFHEHFKALTALTPLQFQKQLRLLEAKRLLQTGEYSVSSASYKVGYESPSQFSREYSRMYGTAPSRIIKGGSKVNL